MTDTEPLILIVEDNEFTRKVLSTSLNGINYLFAKNGKEALSIYNQHKPALVFLDLNLPDILGMELFVEIKNINPNAFIVIMTADNSTETVKNAIQSGVSGYITKPFARAKLEQYIEKYNETKNV
ncbi:MAG: response regulator [Alphaproteobacteria bacterium]